MYNYFYNTGASSREGQIPRIATPQQRFTQRSCVRTTGIIYVHITIIHSYMYGTAFGGHLFQAVLGNLESHMATSVTYIGIVFPLKFQSHEALLTIRPLIITICYSVQLLT